MASSGSSTSLIIVAVIAGWWMVFTKAGEAGWKSIIPIWNLLILLKIVGREWWWIILLLIPIVDHRDLDHRCARPREELWPRTGSGSASSSSLHLRVSSVRQRHLQGPCGEGCVAPSGAPSDAPRKPGLDGRASVISARLRLSSARNAANASSSGSFASVWEESRQRGSSASSSSRIRAASRDVPGIDGVEQRALLHAHRGQAVAPRELGPVACRTIRRAVAERALEQAAQLDERRVSLLDAEIDDALPPLARRPGRRRCPAPPRPRQSPPSASAASSAASRRWASEPVADENASPIASQTRGDSTRFACATQSVPAGAAGRRHAVRARPLARAPVDRHHPHLAELGQLVVGTEARRARRQPRPRRPSARARATRSAGR